MEYIVFLLGLCIGSFLNVLIDRMPEGRTIWGRSQCDYCKKTLAWYELIPVVSWIIQGAHCRRCHHALSFQYPLVELGTGIGFVCIYSLFNYSFIQFVAYLIVFCSLLVVFVADLKTQIIPDGMLVSLLAGILPLFFLLPVSQKLSHLGAAIGGGLFFYILYRVTRGRGMGFGDVKLAPILGLLLGYPNTVIGFYAAFLTGAIVGVILILGKHAGLKSKIAFGPFLVFGTLVAMVWGEHIALWWK